MTDKTVSGVWSLIVISVAVNCGDGLSVSSLRRWFISRVYII